MKRIMCALLAVTFICGCGQKSDKQPSSAVLDDVISDEVAYISLQIDDNYTDTGHTFGFYDENGTCKGSYAVKTNGDMSYTYYSEANETFYCFGPGGMYSASVKGEHPEISMISDENINCIVPDRNGSLYMYVNGGFEADGYHSTVRTPSGAGLDLDTPVRNMLITGNKLYIETSQDLSDPLSQPRITIFNTETGQAETVYDCDCAFGMLTEISGNVYIVCDAGLYDIADQKTYPYTGNEETIMLTSFDGDLFTVNDTSYLLSMDQEKRHIYRIGLSEDSCMLSKIHTIQDAENIYGALGISGNHVSFMNIKDRPVTLSFADTGTDEQTVNLEYPSEDNVFCVIRK